MREEEYAEDKEDPSAEKLRKQSHVILGVHLLALLVSLSLCVLYFVPKSQMNFISQMPASQIVDWDIQPYVKLIVLDEPCPNNTYDVFNRTWSGTQNGC